MKKEHEQAVVDAAGPTINLSAETHAELRFIAAVIAGLDGSEPHADIGETIAACVRDQLHSMTCGAVLPRRGSDGHRQCMEHVLSVLADSRGELLMKAHIADQLREIEAARHPH